MVDLDSPIWQILVPTQFNDGRHVKLAHHKVWDEKVKTIAGGLTIKKPAFGYWVNREGKTFFERMIPVEIKCTESQIKLIAYITAKHYDQEAIMYYLITDKVFIYNHKKKK